MQLEQDRSISEFQTQGKIWRLRQNEGNGLGKNFPPTLIIIYETKAFIALRAAQSID